MPLLATASPEKPHIRWPAIVATLLVQVVVLLAISGAVIFYLNWSSTAALAEFMATSTPSASILSQLPHSAPAHPINGRKACTRRVS